MTRSRSTMTISLLPLVLVLAFLPACQTKTNTGATKAVCAVFPPITYSRSDTEETQRQVRQHNAGFDAYCGKP